MTAGLGKTFSMSDSVFQVAMRRMVERLFEGLVGF